MPVCQFLAGFTVRENMQLNETAMYFQIIHQGPILQGVSNARAVQPLASYKVLLGCPITGDSTVQKRNFYASAMEFN